MSEDRLVPMPGSGELVDLGDVEMGIKKMGLPALALWYFDSQKPLFEALNKVKLEIIARMIHTKSKVINLKDGRKLNLKIPPKRTCDPDLLDKAEKLIAEKYSQEVQLYRMKKEFAPNMKDIKGAMKLGDDVAKAIALGLIEVDDYPRLEKGGAIKKEVPE